MAFTSNTPTRPTAIALDPSVALFDIVDPFNRVFWKDMDNATALAAIQGFSSQYRVVTATGLDYGARINPEYNEGDEVLVGRRRAVVLHDTGARWGFPASTVIDVRFRDGRVYSATRSEVSAA